MNLKPALFFTLFFTICLVAAPAFSQLDFSEFMVDGELTEEQAEILEEVDRLYQHRNAFIEEYANERLEAEREELLADGPLAVREAADRFKEEGEEAYRAEHGDKVKEVEAHKAELRAIAERQRGETESADDDDGAGQVQVAEAPDEQELAAIFDGVDGEIAVFSRKGRKVTRNDGHIIMEDDGHVIEFCYADTGCEDRSDVKGRRLAGVGEIRIHQSDPEKEVVGLRLRLKIGPHSAGTASVFVTTGHTSDAFGSPFEVEDTIFKTRFYEPGDAVTYDLGKTD